MKIQQQKQSQQEQHHWQQQKQCHRRQQHQQSQPIKIVPVQLKTSPPICWWGVQLTAPPVWLVAML